MVARIAGAFAALLLVAHSASAADLTDTEHRWLAGATPPVAWALKHGMPVDIVVLPQARPGAAAGRKAAAPGAPRWSHPCGNGDHSRRAASVRR